MVLIGGTIHAKNVARFLQTEKKERPMTMAPNRKKRGYWIEIIFIGVLLFLLMGSRAQSTRVTGPRTDLTHTLHRTLSVQPIAWH
jgi:hypothetical protein